MKIRIEGTPEECVQAAERIAQVLDVREHSRPYPNRPPSQLVRVYLDVQAPSDAAADGQGGSGPMSRPRRLQLRRTRGWRLPAAAASVAYPTRWQNPHRPAERSPEANARAVALYREHLAAHPDLVADARRTLAGRDLACWCRPGLPCHADVLLEIANDPMHERPRS